MRQIDFDKAILRSAGLVVVVVCLLVVSPAIAQSGGEYGEYELSWSTIDGGVISEAD